MKVRNINNEQVDWSKIVGVARRYGLRKSGRELGVNYQVLCRIENGQQPEWILGQRLIVFWMIRTGEGIGSLPMVNQKPATERAFLLFGHQLCE